MRIFDALLGALTVLLVFAFIREVLPGVPWAATVGALCIALQPLFGFMSGTLSPEVMLYAVSAALFLCLARAFRRGLSRRGAIVLGILIAVGFLTKLTFAGVAFGVFVGLIALGVRELRSHNRSALAPPAIAAGIGIAPVALYALVNSLSGKQSFGYASTLGGVLASTRVFNAVSYIWELYLPRLPGMVHYFNGVFTSRDIWFDRFVGLYGWLDTQFPSWVENLALILASAMALLCVRALIVGRRAVRARWLELVAYAAIAFGLLVMVGAASYSSDALEHREAYVDPRYLLALLPLLGVAVTLAVRGAGRRWAPIVGAMAVVAFLSHDIFSQLQEIARYYG
jgi:4-amino-4-deoxy-L-arabinose transferase-like glycosyltransferase